MNVRVLACLLCWCATPIWAQGFAGLGQSAEGFALPDANTRFTFPADHGPHPEFRIEWWYVTANLSDTAGTAYGVQWTLFRNALRPGGVPQDQAWMGHAAVSTPKGHFFAERLARGGTAQAGVHAAPFEAWIDEWRISGPSLSEIDVTAQSHEFRFDLEMKAQGPIVPQGLDGFSVKSETGQASHYYSQPFYDVSGTLILPSGKIAVSGQAWLDREWSSQPLTEEQTGWDWVSLHFDDGNKLMGYRLRDIDGAYTVGTWIPADGTPTPLSKGALQMTPVDLVSVAGRELPVTWDIALPERDLSVRVDAIYPESWMGTRIPYWEGPVTVGGTHKGRGYLEMSGY